MMNRANSGEAYVPSMMMSFVGLEDSSQKQQPWDWDTTTTLHHHPIATAIPAATTTTSLALQNHHPFFPISSSLDYPPSLLPVNSFPFYSPPVVDYQAAAAAAFVKREDCCGATAAAAGAGRIGLNLGHRTYFSSGDALAIDRLFARSRGLYSLSHQPPRCQAEGCKADLSGAKHYHRRHKVCEFHSKATVVIAGGLQQRFCQQCSRFHVLAEFDAAKRSCRKRLADHNRRRRKPQLPAGNADSSAPRNPATNSMEKSKQISKAPRDNSPEKSTAAICKTGTSLEGQLEYSNKATPLRNGPDLSLGGVGPVKKGGTGPSDAIYQKSQGQFVAMAEEKVSQQQQQQQQLLLSFSPSVSSGTFFHHHNLFTSSSNEAFPSTGGGSDHTTRHHHQNDFLHPGQAMFEVDFM